MRKLSAYGRPSQWLYPYMCKIFSLTFVSKFNLQPRPWNSKNRKQSQKHVTIDNSTHFNFTLDLSNLISRNKFSRENAPTQQEIMTTCPALSAYNYNRKIKNILSILALYIFKKLQNRHTNTFISRFSRIILGFKSLF